MSISGGEASAPAPGPGPMVSEHGLATPELQSGAVEPKLTIVGNGLNVVIDENGMSISGGDAPAPAPGPMVSEHGLADTLQSGGMEMGRKLQTTIVGNGLDVVIDENGMSVSGGDGPAPAPGPMVSEHGLADTLQSGGVEPKMTIVGNGLNVVIDENGMSISGGDAPAPAPAPGPGPMVSEHGMADTLQSGGTEETAGYRKLQAVAEAPAPGPSES